MRENGLTVNKEFMESLVYALALQGYDRQAYSVIEVTVILLRVF